MPASTQASDGSHYTIRTGAGLRITLPGHGSSGRIWSYTVTGDTGAITVTQETSAPPALPPAGGLPPPSYSLEDIIVVRGNHPGAAAIDFSLARPHAPPVEQRRITVQVLPTE